jgi:hypothetical protein
MPLPPGVTGYLDDRPIAARHDPPHARVDDARRPQSGEVGSQGAGSDPANRSHRPVLSAVSRNGECDRPRARHLGRRSTSDRRSDHTCSADEPGEVEARVRAVGNPDRRAAPTVTAVVGGVHCARSRSGPSFPSRARRSGSAPSREAQAAEPGLAAPKRGASTSARRRSSREAPRPARSD